jgi:hypothetical protein
MRLASGQLLLHIGPHKTGSTALQHAFHDNRDRLLAQGVHVAGPRTQPMTAAMVASTGSVLPTRTEEARSSWDRLVEEVEQSGADRTVLSSEFFCEADAEHATGILERLGAGTRVVITLRPLARILASQWQQFVQNRLVTSYPTWLQAVLTDVATTETPSFWRRHRHDLLVRRWAECAGPDRVTVVVVDERDPDALLRTFEQLLDVAPGTLEPADLGTNRSLRYAEVELLRRFNEQWRARGWSEGDYTRVVRFGAVRHLQSRTPARDEARILTPAWAVARAQEISAQVVAAVAGAGVEVVGDLHSLTEGLPQDAVGDNEPADTVPVDVAARFAAGVGLRVAQLAGRPLQDDRRLGDLELAARALRADSRARRTAPLSGTTAARALDDVGTGALVRAVARGAVARARRPEARRSGQG